MSIPVTDSSVVPAHGSALFSWRKVTFAAALFIVGVLTVDQLLARLLDFGTPYDYRVFVDSRRAFDNAPQDYDALILGDSFLADAIDPAFVAQSAHISAFNYGIYSSSYGDTWFLLRDKLATGWTPNVVLVGLGPLLFDRDDIPGGFLLNFIDSPMLRAELIWKGLWAGDLSVPFASGRDRSKLSGLARLVLTGEPGSGRGAHIAATRDGYIENTANYGAQGDALLAEGAAFRERLAALPAPRADQVAYLEHVLSDARDAGARIVLVAPPVSAGLARSISDLPFMIAFKRLAEDLSARYDAPLIWGYDPAIAGRFPDTDYFDAKHMCASGARRFSLLLGAALVEEKVVGANPAPPEEPAPVTCTAR